MERMPTYDTGADELLVLLELLWTLVELPAITGDATAHDVEGLICPTLVEGDEVIKRPLA
jgi:hypothetical protein